MVSGLAFTYGVVAVFFTVNALRTNGNPRSRFPALWLPSMLVSELSPYLLLVRASVAGLGWWAGALDHRVGQIGIWLIGLSVIMLGAVMVRDSNATRAILRSVPTASRMQVPWSVRLTRNPRRLPDGIDLVEQVEYHAGCSLDLYMGPETGAPRPTLLYVHGGGWTGGDPNTVGRALFHHLAERGWVVATVRYPLAPGATFPEPVVAIRRAIAWAKTEGATYGIDPDRIALAGGSAGGHLCTVAGIVDDDRLQPGFENRDTSVRAVVSMYGIFDFFNRNFTRPHWNVIPVAVMKAAPQTDPARYRLASPLDHVRAAMPPMLVVHGSIDSLVPPQESRVFVEEARRHGGDVDYLEVPGAQHSFDAVTSPRTRAVVGAIGCYLENRMGRS